MIKYFKGTVDKGLVYDFGDSQASVDGLHGYTDASYADCPDSSRSTLGYAFFYGDAVISWYSKLHSFVTTSTNHSEYAALALGAKEAKWLAELFDEIDPEPTKAHRPVPIFGDSSGVIALVFNPVDHQANKHIRVADHYARELTKEGTIAPHRVASVICLRSLSKVRFSRRLLPSLLATSFRCKLNQCLCLASTSLTNLKILQCVPCRLLTNCVNSWVECIICKGQFSLVFR